MFSATAQPITFPTPLALPSAPTVAIGNFDGVHPGHQHLLHTAQAANPTAPLVVLTFEPHPRTVLFPHQPLTRLSTLASKTTALLAHGAHHVAVLPFTHAVAGWSPQQFITTILRGWLNASTVVVGANFRFGHRAGGTAQTLAACPHFRTIIVPLLTNAQGQPISSTLLRQAPPSNG